MDVYRGADKVATLGSYDELRVGANKPAFIYEGGQLVYPNPVKDGLVLWYDFSGRTNSDAERGVAEDLSGNGNHGTLQNFNYTAESGYDKNNLLFDYIDDIVDLGSAITSTISSANSFTLSMTLKSLSDDNSQYILRTGNLNILKHYTYYDLNIRTSSGAMSHHYSSGFEMAVGEVLNWVVICHTDHFILYLNGVEIINSPYKNNELADLSTAVTINDNFGNTGSFSGGIYSAQLYSHSLTPEEIAHNYAIEKERFNL